MRSLLCLEALIRSLPCRAGLDLLGGTTDTAKMAAVARSADEARPPEFARNSATTETVFAESSGKAGFSLSRTQGTTSADVTVVVKSAGKARPPGIAKHSATTVVGEARPSEIAEYSATATAKTVGDGEARPHGFAMYRATTESKLAESATVAKSVGIGETRPPGIAKYRATTESELAESSTESSGESSDETGSSWSADEQIFDMPDFMTARQMADRLWGMCADKDIRTAWRELKRELRDTAVAANVVVQEAAVGSQSQMVQAQYVGQLEKVGKR